MSARSGSLLDQADSRRDRKAELYERRGHAPVQHLTTGKRKIVTDTIRRGYETVAVSATAFFRVAIRPSIRSRRLQESAPVCIMQREDRVYTSLCTHHLPASDSTSLLSASKTAAIGGKKNGHKSNLHGLVRASRQKGKK